MPLLAVAFGCFVGFALGLTGGGGGIFAVPMLVYGLSVKPHEAVGISLAAVGGTALSGAIPRLIRREIDLTTGVLFALAGMLGAPIGSVLSTRLPETILLVCFACLMLLIAYRMWSSTTQPKPFATQPDDSNPSAGDRPAQAASRTVWTTRDAMVLALVGMLTGVLSGLFGVGGGFVIVPALVLLRGMPMHTAVSTSLFVIVLVSVSGVASHLFAGNAIPLPITFLFIAGGLVGMWLGGSLAKRLDGVTLRKLFSFAIVLVAGFVIIKSATT